MKTIKGPGIYLAQFAADDAPFNRLDTLAQWVADRGFKGVQIPTWDTRLINLKLAAESQTYCDEIKGTLASKGLEITELASHITGQLVAVHPVHDQIMDSFAPRQCAAIPQPARSGPWSKWATAPAPPRTWVWTAMCRSPVRSCGRISTPIRSGLKA